MIPIYRAKKIDSDEWIEGYYSLEDNCHIVGTDETGYFDIDLSTLAIHFPNMIDKNGKKIFASLSKDGIGGSLVNSIYQSKIVAIWNTFPAQRFEWMPLQQKAFRREFNELIPTEIEVIGIHKG